MEGLHTLRELLKPGDWMAKVDQKDSYIMVPVHDGNRPLVHFVARECLYQFTCLSFGLSCTPWVFTKTLKPVAATLRELGVRLVIYIVDILVMVESQDKVRVHNLGLIYLLKNLGFIIYSEKTLTVPTQEIEFLGMQVDSSTLELRVPGFKLKKLRQEAAELGWESVPPTAREVSHLLGKMISVSQAVAPAPLFFRRIQRDLAAAPRKGSLLYKVPYPLSLQAIADLSWWAEQLTKWNGKGLALRQPDMQIESDSSLMG